MDHVKHGKTLKHFVYPPQQPSGDEIEAFADGLKESIPQKLEEVLKRRQELEVEKEKKLEVVNKKTNPKSFDRYFWSSVVFNQFAEYFVLQKWVKYWLILWYRVNEKDLPRELHAKLSSITKTDIEKARTKQIEEFYEGQLKQSGSKLVTICPFHQDKNPSFFIFPDNHYHCYGCNEHGDVIDFVMKTKGLNFIEAVRYLL